jgi:hypothetical protein
MAHKNTPIVKKKIAELLKELPVIERLQILEPLCDKYRKESRAEVEKDVNEWSRKKGLPRIKTDY